MLTDICMMVTSGGRLGMVDSFTAASGGRNIFPIQRKAVA